MVLEAGLAQKRIGSPKPNLPVTHFVCHSLSVIPPKNLANGQVGHRYSVGVGFNLPGSSNHVVLRRNPTSRPRAPERAGLHVWPSASRGRTHIVSSGLHTNLPRCPSRSSPPVLVGCTHRAPPAPHALNQPVSCQETSNCAVVPSRQPPSNA